MKQDSSSPIFIHSLYRAGSTWLFDCFRHAEGAGYWCYQEPFHEALARLKDEPEAVLGADRETSVSIHYSEHDRPYFFEIYSIRDQVADIFQKCISFDSFFDPETCPAFAEYTGRLIRHAKGRPVLQCCRSFARVDYLRNRFGGVHIHLWRNPWDQWWSYQTSDYFDTTNLAIINAFNPPPIVEILRAELGFEVVRKGRFADEYARLLRFPIDAENRYLLFYSLWLYSLIENQKISDCDVNIDRLSVDPDYTRSIIDQLGYLGVRGLDLSNCQIPRSVYADEDRAFFQSVERRAHRLFVSAGYDLDALHQTLQRRREYQPQGQNDVTSLIRDSQRARIVALRHAGAAASAAGRALQASMQAESVVARALEAEFQAKAAEERASELSAILHAVHASRSWRLTHLLRWFNLQRRLLRQYGMAARGTALFKKIARLLAGGVRIPGAAAVPRQAGDTGPQRLVTKAKRGMRAPLVDTIKWAGDIARRSPRFKRFALRIIRRFPNFQYRLRRAYQESIQGNLPRPGNRINNDVTTSNGPVREGGAFVASLSGSGGINADQRSPLESNFQNYLRRP